MRLSLGDSIYNSTLWSLDSLHYYCIVTHLLAACWTVTGYAPPLYARGVSRPSPPERSPTLGLLLGLFITLSAVVAYSAYITWQVTGLRKLQTGLVDRNRRDSLQLLRIQNDLNVLAVAMRDMVSGDEPYPLTAWSAQFQRIRTDLDDAIRLEADFAAASRTPEQSAFLTGSFTQFWDAVDRVFALAHEGKEKEARAQIQLSLQERQAALSTAVARLLVQNSENEEQAALRIVQIYDRVQLQVYIFLAATLLAILLSSLSIIRWNRRLFARLEEISARRSELAQKLISTQESTLRYISRELHDEFGQILTAVGSMLRRAGTHAPEGSSLRADLQEVLQTVQTTLESVRSLSQALHPVMLDEAGLESTLDWYIPTVERQTGIAISYEKRGEPFPVDGGAGVHIYRVLQEALNNVARHSGAKQAWVRLLFLPDAVELEVEDHGVGFADRPKKQGIGLVAMRERSELMGGRIVFSRPPEGGTRVHLFVPREKAEAYGKEDHSLARG
ncbi:MAG TPA: ATP-binding protein [Candidatus Sulfotelmatobacter sp.]|nr:ATP-binding protein [Candidatus Sulfotelmatobacter sp.]